MRIKLHGKEIIHEYYERRYERTNTKHEKLDKYCMTRSRVGTHTKKRKKKGVSIVPKKIVSIFILSSTL